MLLARAGAMVVRMVGSWDSIIARASVDDVKGLKVESQSGGGRAVKHVSYIK